MNVVTMGTSINYEAAGDGIPLLAIHGWGVDHALMSGCLEPVFDRASLPCRRYYPDLPGMGRSPGSDGISGSDDMLEYVEAFIDALFPDRPFLLAGESYGGYLARGLLRKRATMVKGLLLICPTYKPYVKTEAGIDKGDVPEHRVIEEDEAFLAEMNPVDRTAFQFMAVRRTREAWDLFHRDVLPGIRAADQIFLKNRLSRNVPFRIDPDDHAPPFEDPTLIVTGRQDSAVGYRGIWSILEKYPRATFAVLDGSGHNLQTERVPLFNALVSDWLERVGYVMAEKK